MKALIENKIQLKPEELHLTTKDVMDMKLALIHQSHKNVLKDLISVLSDLTSPSNYEILKQQNFSTEMERLLFSTRTTSKPST